MKIFISQKQAKRQLKEATGLTANDCADLVDNLKKKMSGKRLLVRSADVEAIVAEMKQPVKKSVNGIKPLAKKQVVNGKVRRTRSNDWPSLIN